MHASPQGATRPRIHLHHRYRTLRRIVGPVLAFRLSLGRA
jgi:hypothetical protein